MDSSPKGASSTSNKDSILVHVVSPSVEVPNKLTFESISPSLTITGLKRRITDIVPSRPAPERQRLIYKGKPLINQEATLGSIFGFEEV